jgi:Fe-S-cluster containining protein
VSAAADRYRALLGRLDRWFAERSAAHPGVVPCRAGCADCCHGPFDISVADAALLADAFARLAPEVRAEVRRRAGRLLARARRIEPGWQPPIAVAALADDEGDARRFDALCSALHDAPCPLLDDAGRCRVYADRPLVCRMIGLPMKTPRGRVIENACPIQGRFPGYAALPPQPFDLEPFEEEEAECLRDCSRSLFSEGGSLARFAEPAEDGAREAGFETFIAALLAILPEPPG